MIYPLTQKKDSFITAERIALFLILLCGMAVRLSLFKSINGAVTISDSPTYVDGAYNLFRHFWLSEYRPPVYLMGIMLIGVLYSWEKLSTGIVVLQVLLSLVNVIFIYKLTREAFNKKTLALFTALVTAVSFRVYSWDFVILTENFSILIVTLVTYYSVCFIKYGNLKYIRVLTLLCITAVFLKPFFLALPPAVAGVIAMKYLLFKEAGIKQILVKLCTGLAIVVLCILSYSVLNFFQNHHFGLSTVGNVNSFGKILQYNMEDLGSNPDLIRDIKAAFSAEKPEYIVDGSYLEPWHFIGTHGWNRNHYADIAEFSRKIILRHPFRYISESIRLTIRLLAFNSPFKDFIVESAVIKSGHPDRLMLLAKKLTEAVDLLYPLLLLGMIEAAAFLALRRKEKAAREKYLLAAILCMILYHYVISAFLSYGDYCRLLAPCTPLIYVVIALYLYRAAAFIFHFGKKAISRLAG